MNLLGGSLDVVVRGGGVDDIVVQQVALFVQADDLAARAESRVNCQHALAAQGRCEQQLAHILGKGLDGFIVGLLFGCRGKLGLYRWLDEALETVLGSLLDEL